MGSTVIIGVGGLFCSGKNEVACIITDQGFEHIDVDKIGHEILLRESARVEALFPAAYANGQVDRGMLAKIVFSSKKKLRILEGLLHPLMKMEIERRLREGGSSHKFLINAALLFSMELHLLCQKILWVETPLFTRIQRARRHRNASWGTIIRILWHQRDISSKSFYSTSDIYNVRNSGTRQELYTLVLQWLYE